MPKYRVYASQEVFYYKDVEAANEARAEEKAWETDDESWNEFHFGDWQAEDGTELIEEKKHA